MRVLLTGGAGYIGSHLVARLLQAGHEVTVLDNLLYRQTGLMGYCSHPNFRFVLGDVRDHALLRQLVTQAEVIIPLAAIVGFPACERDKRLATEVNFEHVKAVTDLWKPGQRLLIPNTNSAYGRVEGIATEESPLTPLSHYAKTKQDAEDYLLNHTDGISFRLATVFGISPRMRLDLLVNDFVYKAVTDRYIVLFEKNFKRNFIHISDVASAFIYLLDRYDQHHNQVFNVGLSDANLTKLELCEKIKEQVPTFSIKYDEIASDPDKRDYCVSNEKIAKTGWSPAISLESGIRELISAYTILSHSLKLHTNL